MKLTQKQYNGWKKARSEGGATYNEAYNKDKYGITLKEYTAINSANRDATGIGIASYKSLYNYLLSEVI